MCGIFAYSGPRKAAPILIEGLKKLEYRGYDSAGWAVFNGHQIERLRVCGGVSELEKKTRALSPKGFVGIGHTRWATHGAPSEKNAHPHRSHFIYVAHNGVIENTEKLKQIIGRRPLSSDTDTEVISRLIHHFCEREQLDFLSSVLKSAPLLQGSYAVAAISEKQPDEIIAFKSGPPLALCRAKNEFFISSDPQSVEPKADQIIFLEDEEALLLKKDQFQIFSFQGQAIARKFKKRRPEGMKSEKGRHPHFMIKEILEQPGAIARLVSSHINKGEIALKLSKGNKKNLNSLLKSAGELIILACGSSYHSALFAKYFLEDIAQIRVNVEIASEFIYRKAFASEGAVAWLISQSGETADTLAALKKIKKMGLKSLSLCNVKDSSLERQADFALSLLAGPEIAVASTKTFAASLTALSILAFHLAKIKKLISSKQEREFVSALLSLPSHLEKTLACDQFFLKITEELKAFKAFFYLGRGPGYPIALEGALKLKEIAYLHAEAYPSGEMKHGPLAMIDKSTAIVALLPPPGILYQKSLTNLKEAKSRGARIMAIGGAKKDKELRDASDYQLALPDAPERFYPLLALIPLQLLAYYMSRSYGYNADKPRNLAKSVTVE